MKGKFTIGTDSEFFLVSKTTGAYKSAIPLISGTKYEPEVLENKSGLQHDNVAMEFATPVANSLTELLKYIRGTLKIIKAKLPADTAYCSAASASFPHEELKDPAALEFGCDPDYNAWEDGAINPKPESLDKTFRSCGGHIHVGYVEGSGNDFLLQESGKIRMIKIMDAMHGVVSTVLDHNIPSVRRRYLYGKAGSYRPTPYGVEYRVLSNYWVKSPLLVSLMYHLTDEALTTIRLQMDTELIKMMGGYSEIGSIINNGLIGKATSIVNEVLLPRFDLSTVKLMKKANRVRFNKAIDQAWGIV